MSFLYLCNHSDPTAVPFLRENPAAVDRQTVGEISSVRKLDVELSSQVHTLMNIEPF